MGSDRGDAEDAEQFTPFRPFTRQSLFNIEQRIAEEHAAKVSAPFTNFLTFTGISYFSLLLLLEPLSLMFFFLGNALMDLLTSFITN